MYASGKAMVLMPGAGCEGDPTDFVLDPDDKLRLKCVSSRFLSALSWNIHRNRSIKFKKARDAPDQFHNENANAAKMERLLEDGINAHRPWTAGNGRKIFRYGVNIENTAAIHPRSGVAVNGGMLVPPPPGHIVVNPDLTVIHIPPGN